jgi:hypothetical protein
VVVVEVLGHTVVVVLVVVIQVLSPAADPKAGVNKELKLVDAVPTGTAIITIESSMI